MVLRFFKLTEFACPCGRKSCDAVPVEPGAALSLDELRAEFGEPMIITSACRCSVHNKAVGGKKASQHLLGRAFDIHCPDGLYMIRLAALAIKRGWAVGVKAGMLHLDRRHGPPVMFGY